MKHNYLVIGLIAMLCLVSLSAFALPSQAASTTLRLKPVRGVIGVSVSVTGLGYPANSIVTLTGLFSTTCPTNSTGGISSCSVSVPNVAAGAYLVYASSGPDSTQAKFTVGSRAHIRLHPISGLPGSTVTVTGTHFGWDTKFTVTFKGAKVATGTTTSTGTFSISFSVPSDSANSYIVTVKDSLNYTASAVYTIT